MWITNRQTNRRTHQTYLAVALFVIGLFVFVSGCDQPRKTITPAPESEVSNTNRQVDNGAVVPHACRDRTDSVFLDGGYDDCRASPSVAETVPI
jgi:hypothetical protein